MKQVEKHISQFIEQQFPEFYRSEGPMFITFVKAYYEWLESEDQALYQARRLPDYRDIDDTLEEFIVYFKEKYLKNIQFTTASNKQLFIKNSLDFYRSKGTERSVDLFFKLVYALPSRVYTPGDDIFKLSSGDWVKPTYLEITNRKKNIQFVGKQIIGVDSNASAFVERLVRKKSKGRYIDIFYISNITGNFKPGELLKFDDNIDGNPFVVGSLSDLTVINGGDSFVIGETVRFISNTGSSAKAIVSNTSSADRSASFELIDGGFGYTSNSEVIISEQVITVSNLRFTTTPTGFTFPFETVSQKLANIKFDSSNGDFTIGEGLFMYDSNNDLIGSATILGISQEEGNTEGTLFISVVDDFESETIFYTSGNSISANIILYEDKTATANLLGTSRTIDISLSNVVGTFTIGEVLTQPLTSARGTISSVVGTGSNYRLRLLETENLFFSTLPVLSPSGNGIVESFAVTAGLNNIVNQFVPNSNNKIITTFSNVNGEITRIGSGSGASFEIGTFDNIETINYDYTDLLNDYLTVNLNAESYGFPKEPSANLTSHVLDDILNYSTINVGSVASLTAFNPGSNYTDAPFVLIYDDFSYQYLKNNISITYTNATRAFLNGEIVTGSSSGARGEVISQNGDTLNIKRLSLLKDFYDNEILIGQSSSANAQIVSVITITPNIFVGLNANVIANVNILDGSVTSLRIIDSGIGYENGENITFYSTANTNKTGVAQTIISKQGEGEGFYREVGGFISDGKYLHDGEYYQEYSYEILTALPFEAYADIFKKVVHVAGTKVFGTYVGESEDSIELTSDSEIVMFYYLTSINITSTNTVANTQFNIDVDIIDGNPPFTVELNGFPNTVSITQIDERSYEISGVITEAGIY